ncbi:MAG: DUF4080 domain-containing protein [Clostridiales bacterium]|nr:DUF4080 domain-containing protein [Clostridiales bacterium]
MKILLTTLNSKYIHSSPALKYLYGAAQKSGAQIDVREFTINNDDDYIFGELLSKEWDVVCFSCYIWNIERILYLAENLKKARPRVKILLGGPEVSFDAIEVMKKNRFIDFIIKGEGEMPFPMLMRMFRVYDDTEMIFQKPRDMFDDIDDGIAFDLGRETGGSAGLDYSLLLGYTIADIPNLVYRHDGKIYVNGEKDPDDFENAVFPYTYFDIPQDKIVYYESSRGCPFRCAYCLSSIEKTIRPLSLERVFRELSYFIRSGIKQVKFIDRTFNYDSQRARDILGFIIANDNGVTNFHFEICSDLLDEETLDVIRRARKGLFQFEIGVQSTNQKTLEAINRGGTLERTINMAKRLIDIGNSEVHVDLIAGLPYEGYKTFGKSFDDVYALGADMFALGFLKLLKGTSMRDDAEKYGYIYREKAPYEVISNDFISAKELIRLKKIEAVLDLYFNRKGFGRTLEYIIKTKFAGPFEFYEDFADYYYEKGFQHVSHKKEDLYRILNKYAESFTGDGADGCEESDTAFEGIEDRSFGFTGHVRGLLMQDMEDTLNFDAIKKFVNKGWEI